MSDVNVFHAHLDVCQRCANEPFNLCAIGAAALRETVRAGSDRCAIPAGTLPPCDLEYGHDGDMHANCGDGFYARQHDDEHHARQTARAARAVKGK